MKAPILAAVLAALCAATASSAEDTPNLIIANPGTLVFALKLPYGAQDPAAKDEASGRSGHTKFAALYRWFSLQTSGEDKLVYGDFADFRSQADQAWKDHGDKEVRQVVVLVSAHGSHDGISDWNGEHSVSWGELESFLESLRGRMDVANKHAHLVVFSDACHSGELWRRMAAATRAGKLHTWVFLAGADADHVATTDLVPDLIKVLHATDAADRDPDGRRRATWRVVYESLKGVYDGWGRDDKGAPFWTAAFYADSAMNRPLSAPAPKDKPTGARAVEVSCASCGGSSCAARSSNP